MNSTNLHYLNIFLGAGAIILQIFSIFSLLVLFFVWPGQKKKGEVNHLLRYLDRHYLALGFFISLFASAFSLVYSEIVGFPPCVLCWWQRVFMFPQVILFCVAFWDRDRKVLRYSLPLLALGFLVALYQTFEYYFTSNSSGACDPTGVSCFTRLVSEFGGYISIPMLSLTAFLGLLVLSLVVHFQTKNPN